MLALILVGSSLRAQAPNSISYSGMLTDTKSVPLDGQYTMTFRIFSTPMGGTPLHQQTINNVVVRNGQFNVFLASFNDNVFTQGTGDRYLEMRVGSDPPLLPRQPMISVPFALRTGSVDGDYGCFVAYN